MRLLKAGLLLVLLLGIITGCSVPPPKTIPAEKPLVVPERKKAEPYIRIGIVWGADSVEFTTDNGCRITSHDGTFIARGMKGHRWKAQIETDQPGQIIYRLVAASMSSMESARNMVSELKGKGFDSFIIPMGSEVRIGSRLLSDNRTFRVCLSRAFYREEDAREYKESIYQRLDTFLMKQPVSGSRGTIVLINLDTMQKFESTNPILIRETTVTIKEVPVGVGFHWEHRETRQYPETIAFQIDGEGKLTVINALPLETYLQGVIPSEMPNGFPLEALKAQTIAARSEAVSKMGKAHLSEPFDLCADVHCQVYSGLSQKSPRTDKAVKETLGLVLWKDGVCDAVYSAVCGGHTEDTNNTWGGNHVPYLTGKYDGSGSLKQFGTLSQEPCAKRWIDSTPAAFCNTAQGRILPSMEYTRKYFRWETVLTQAEIRTNLENQTGTDVGAVLNLEPLSRGCSGRIIRLKVHGSREDLILDRELNIRKALSSNTLWSSCFYVIKRGWKNGSPEAFVLKGAGFGHGVGMCQTGAAVMALNGAHFEEILKHYYHGAKIRKLY